MIEDEQTCALLLEEIHGRFPLYETVLETVSNWNVVTCSFPGGAKGFVPYTVVEHDEFTSKCLRDIVGVMEALRRRGCGGQNQPPRCEYLRWNNLPSRDGHMEDPSWRRNCDLLTGALHSLERSTSHIRHSTNKLATLRDIAREREKVKQVTGRTNAKEVHAIQDALGLMEKYMRLNPTQLRGQCIKLTTEAKVAMEKYQKSCDAFYKKCINVEESLRSSGKTTHVKISDAVSTGSDNDDADESSDLLQKRATVTVTQKEIFERDLHDEIMAERRRETSEIADNVKDINEIFNHIHSMVEEQGETLDVIEGNVGVSRQATAKATNHLRQAQQYQENPTRNKFLLLFVLVMAFIVFVVVILS